MPRLTKAERAELEARLAADDEDEDDELEIEYEGRRVRGSASRVTKIAAAWGFKLQADPPEAKDDAKDDDGKPVRFAGRRLG